MVASISAISSPSRATRMLTALLLVQNRRRLASIAALYGALRLAFGGLYSYPWQLPGVALRITYVTTVAITEYVARGCKPLFDEWTLPFEIMRAVLRCIVMYYSSSILDPARAQFLRRQCEWAGVVLGAIACRQNDTYTETFTYNGLEHVWVRLNSSRPSSSSVSTSSNGRPKYVPVRRCVLLYYHGGGYAIVAPKYYISSMSELLVKINNKLLETQRPGDPSIQIEVLLANYRKAPEFPYPTPPNDAVTMFRYLVDVEGVSPDSILVAGDSAGAGLALATLVRVRDQTPMQLPCGAILSCPYVDLEMRGDERKAPYCVLANGAIEDVPRGYVPWGGCPKTWGDASPLHCNLGGLPPVYVITGEFDYILPQAQRLMERAKEDGATNWTLDVHRHMVHVFMNLPSMVLPSASRGLEAMAVFAAGKLSTRPACAC